MHIHFEKTTSAQCDCTILSMSWMGKVPDELPEDEGWKLNRTHYYQEGWLATGNVRGVLGVTYTTSHWKKNPSDVPLRTNYNLRGHRSQITLVQWNEPYQKLASCDSSGIIFVWIKFEGRWSIELINDRNTPVTHFSWSHDGRMALICYQDGFVLVGSVAGQRYWSTMLTLDATITCGIWTPDDQQVYFGTSNGQVVVMDVHGVMVSQVQLPSDSPISSMAWSCEKFKMEESEDGEATSSSNHYCSKRPFLLAVCFKTGGIYLMKSYDDVAPIYISTGMHGLHMEWSNSGEFLAVAGSRPIEVLHENGSRLKEYSNSLHVYNHQGVRIVNINIPHVLSPVTSMTWGHNDKRIFVATGKLVHVGWVSKRIASLQLLCRLAIYKSLSTETCVSHLPLPLPVRALISSLHTQTIPSLLQNIKDLRDFVTHPPNGNLRLYCTMIRHDDDANQSPGTAYTLYLEYLGGLIPILKGKRTSKIRPEFVIYDPQATSDERCLDFVQPGPTEKCCGSDGSCCCACHCTQNSHHHQYSESHPGGATCSSTSICGNGSSHHQPQQNGHNTSSSSNTSTIGSSAASLGLGFSDSSESEDVELCASPRMQRKRYRNRQRERERLLEREREREWERTRSSVHLMPEPAHPHQLVYNDVLPEAIRLVEVTSNIWGTKFKIHGVSPSLPQNLGQVTYKTSLLHLQPRQMTLLITELRDDLLFTPENLLVPGAFLDEDEEDLSVVVGPEPCSSSTSSNQHHHMQNGAVIMQNGMGGGGVRGDVYTGANVIYHPQGVPRGEDSPPIISTSRCYLQSASQSSSGVSTYTASPGSNYRHSSTPPGPSSSSGASTSSCASSSSHLHYYASPSSASTTTRSDSAPPLDFDDQDEFPYVDLTANSEIVSFRESLRINYESGGGSAREPLGINNLVSNCRSSMCQVCEPTAAMQTPVKVVATVGGEGAADLSMEKAMLRVKYGMTRAQIERVVDNDGNVGGVATSTPTPPRNSSRSLRSPKKVSNFGSGASQGISSRHLGTPTHGGSQVANGGAAVVVSAVPVEINHLQAPPPSTPHHVPYPSSSRRHHHHHHPQQQHPPPLQPVPVTAPMFVRRSMSASYLDNVDRNVVISLDVVGNEQGHNSPPKRLILIKKRGQEGGGSPTVGGGGDKPRLKDWGKSKSWDSCDLSAWKQASAHSATSAHRREVATSSCPKCRFPSTEPAKNCVTMAEPLLRGLQSKVPMTPAKRNVMTNCSTSKISGGGYLNGGRSRQLLSSQEDAIEIVNEPPPFAHIPPPSSTPPPAPPAPVHRRSLSLLTPLLRRRELINAARQQSVDGTPKHSQNNNNAPASPHPHSSTFIPPGSPQHQPRSSPSTPATTRRKQSYLSSASSPFRQLFINSPLLTRRKNSKNNATPNPGGITTGGGGGIKSQRRRSIIDSSDEEGSGVNEEGVGSAGVFDDNQPLKVTIHHQSSASACCLCDRAPNANQVPFANTSTRDCGILHRTQVNKEQKRIQYVETCPVILSRREFLMHNKAPMWNENSQVYQLDFGGRVTQESAKNFQIEFRGKQVMQFGRIDGSAYTLDFQYPFAAVQAFSVALANVTQRLK